MIDKCTSKPYSQSFTLDEIHRLNQLDAHKPSDSLTNELWQKQFAVTKQFITPYPPTIKRLSGKYSREKNKWNEDEDGQFDGLTNYQRYCAFINDIISELKKGHVEYVYFYYHIWDLLKFFYDTLNTKYVADGQYWAVWLER